MMGSSTTAFDTSSTVLSSTSLSLNSSNSTPMPTSSLFNTSSATSLMPTTSAFSTLPTKTSNSTSWLTTSTAAPTLTSCSLVAQSATSLGSTSISADVYCTCDNEDIVGVTSTTGSDGMITYTCEANGPSGIPVDTTSEPLLTTAQATPTSKCTVQVHEQLDLHNTTDWMYFDISLHNDTGALIGQEESRNAVIGEYHYEFDNALSYPIGVYDWSNASYCPGNSTQLNCSGIGVELNNYFWLTSDNKTGHVDLKDLPDQYCFTQDWNYEDGEEFPKRDIFCYWECGDSE